MLTDKIKGCRTEEESSVNEGQPLAAEIKSLPQPSLSGNDRYYPWVSGRDFDVDSGLLT